MERIIPSISQYIRHVDYWNERAEALTNSTPLDILISHKTSRISGKLVWTWYKVEGATAQMTPSHSDFPPYILFFLVAIDVKFESLLREAFCLYNTNSSSS
jgi:hypothetical protein